MAGVKEGLLTDAGAGRKLMIHQEEVRDEDEVKDEVSGTEEQPVGPSEDKGPEEVSDQLEEEAEMTFEEDTVEVRESANLQAVPESVSDVSGDQRALKYGAVLTCMYDCHRYQQHCRWSQKMSRSQKAR